ncbi:MAG: transcription termination factor Rho [Pseudonocardiales bacterium]|nr:transcription termination factor Rho [Pseudonocardiales bacterium]
MTDTQDQLDVLSSTDASAVGATKDQNGAAGAAAARAKRRSGSLSTLLLPELQALANSMGLAPGKMRKSELIAAIEGVNRAPSAAGSRTTKAASKAAPTAVAAPIAEVATGTGSEALAIKAPRARRSASRAAGPAQQTLTDDIAPVADSPRRAETPAAADASTSGSSDTGSSNRGAFNSEASDTGSLGGEAADAEAGTTRTDRSASAEGPQQNRQNRNRNRNRDEETPRGQARDGQARDGQGRDGQNRDGQNRNQNRDGQNRDSQNRDQNRDGQNRDQNRDGQNRDGQNRDGQNRDGQNRDSQNRNNADDDDDFGGNRRGRRFRDRRGRNRDRFDNNAGGGRQDAEPTIGDDDVLIPVAGILDAVEDKNTWFIRTAGYFASPEDVYVANSHIRRFGLRRGDAVTGMVKQPRDGDRKEKFNPLVRLDTVNGVDPEQAKQRVEFTKLTPLYPQDRLRLETEQNILTTRIIDLVMPIGKGQRALVVSPPKAGKTSVLQAIANAIAVNNPECHLMVVLVDERPEEVTDMQRSVKGEVIASTFDRRPQDHTMIAELSIERAKRLVEMGHDVVVLLDSITRLGRAYNLAAPASGRILSGGVDSTALYPPKRFLGAARNIEDGGSLTIIATALVETGSTMDTVIFEEFKGTGNAELILDRKIADKRVFPAIDVDKSGTRKEEILLGAEELAVVLKLRRVLHALDAQQGIELLLTQLKKSRTNIEFLMQIAKTSPGADDR